MKTLLENGANATIKNRKRQSPVHVAQNVKVQRLLQSSTESLELQPVSSHVSVVLCPLWASAVPCGQVLCRVGKCCAMPPVGKCCAMPPVGKCCAMPPVGKCCAMPPVGKCCAMPPVGKCCAMPICRQVLCHAPCGQVLCRAPCGQVLCRAPCGQVLCFTDCNPKEQWSFNPFTAMMSLENNKRAKFETLKAFCLLFCTTMRKDFHQNA